MENYTGGGNEIKLYICARQKTEVTVSIPLKGFSNKFTILKDTVIEISLPLADGHTTTHEVVDLTGVHIESDFPVSVSAMNLRGATTDATVVLPLKNIPINPRYVTGHPGFRGFSGLATNEFLIVSPEDRVEIEIVPTSATLSAKPANTPFKITLNKGETYQVQSSGLLDGSTVRVLNDKKVIVLSGDKCSNFPCVACDHQVEQMFPTVLLDTAYCTIPQWGHTKGYVVKVMSIDTLLWIKVNGKSYKIPRRDSALIFSVPIEDSVLYITAPRKFACFEFMNGTTCNGYVGTGRFGDPSMLQLLSSKYMGQKSTFSTVTSSSLKGGDHFVSILIPSSAKNDVFLDNTRLSPSEFIEVTDNKAYSYAKLKLTQGTHTVLCNKGHLAYCYGISPAESYLYVAGYSLPNFDISIIDTTLSYNCKDSTVTMRFTAKLEGAIKSYNWDFGDGSPLDTHRIVKHVYKVNKPFTIKLWAQGFNNKKDSIIKKYTFTWPEFNPVFDKVLCDSFYVFEEKNPFFTNFKWHDKSTNNNYKTTKTEKIWVTATDTSGYCKFVDSASISKIDVVTKVFVDTFSHCHLNNLYRFRDSSLVKNDAILYKVWIFPSGESIYDSSDFMYHFRQPGKLKVYLDIYPKSVNCKARYEIPVNVDWNTDIGSYTLKEKYCSGEMATIKDSSYACCQKVKKYYWQLEDGTKLSSDSGIMRTRVYYNYTTNDPILDYFYITENTAGCFDTMKYGLLVWPAAKANFDFGPDTSKCLVLSRWTFTHNYNEVIPGPYSVDWDFGNGKTGTQYQYKNVRYFDTGWHKIKLTTKSQIGCIDSSIKYVRALPQPKAGFYLNDSVQCLSVNSFTVNDTSKGILMNYHWDFGNGTKSNLKYPAPETYAAVGKYKVNLLIENKYPGCRDSVMHVAEIIPGPKADFSIPSDTQCFYKNSLSLKSTSVFVSPKDSFAWISELGIDTAETPKAMVFKSAGWHKIKLKVVDKSGCSDTISKSMYLQNGPSMQMLINDTVQCFSNNNFIINSQFVSSVKGQEWRVNNKLSGNQGTLTLLNQKPDGSYRISLTATSGYGCKDSVVRFITVLPPLTADFSINKDSQCINNNNFSLTGLSAAPGDIITKYWYNSGGNLIGTTKDVTGYKFNQAGKNEILYKIETSQGCIDSIKKSVYLLVNPVALIVADTVCLGEKITMNGVKTVGDFPITDWYWSMGDGKNYSTNPVTHLYNNQGNYTVQLSVKDKFGCTGIANTAYNLVYPLPNAAFTVKTISSDQDFTTIHLIPTYLGFKSYLWRLPDGRTFTTDSPRVNVNRFFKDKIFLKVENSNGCTDTVSTTFFVYPPLEHIYIENAFTPNNDQLNDVFKPLHFDGVSEYELVVFNRWGEILFKTNNPTEGWDGTYKGSQVQQDVYIYTITFKYSDGNRYNAKGNVTLIR